MTPEGTSPEQFFGVGGNFPDHEGGGRSIPGRWEIGCHERGETVSAGDTTTPLSSSTPTTSMRRGSPAPTRWNKRPGPRSRRLSHTGRRRPTPDGPRPGRPAPRDGGYDAEDFKLGPTYVVERAGQTIARLVLGAPADTWSATLWTCEGSSIARGGRERRPARDGRDDRVDPRRPRRAVRGYSAGARVRRGAAAGRRPACRGDHVGRDDPHLVADDGSTEAFVSAGSEPDTFVVSVPPGKAWVIACLPPDSKDKIDAGPDDLLRVLRRQHPATGDRLRLVAPASDARRSATMRA